LFYADADEAQKQPRLVAALKAEAKQFKFGDYAFQTVTGLWVGLERKGADNLVGSLLTNELTSQLRGLIGCCDIPYLLREGWMTVTSKGYIRTEHKVYELPWGYLEDYLAEIQEAGIRLVHSPNVSFTPTVIRNLYNFWRKPEREHMALKQVKEANFKEFQRPLRRLANFAGYGPEKSHIALSHFKTLRAYFNASPVERMMVKGIGPSLARSLEKELDEVYVG